MTDPYQALSYGARKVGFGERIGIAVVDLQRGFTQPEFPQGGSQLVVSATEATSILLDASRARDIPVVTCAMGYQSESDMPKWKIEAMYGGSFFVGSEGWKLIPEFTTLITTTTSLNHRHLYSSRHLRSHSLSKNAWIPSSFVDA